MKGWGTVRAFLDGVAGAWAVAGVACIATLAPSGAWSAEQKVLFVLDASGSMSAPILKHAAGSAGGPSSRFEAAKNQIRAAATRYEANRAEMGMVVFSHRTGSCEDIAVEVDMRATARGDIERVLSRISERGGTPLASAIKLASTYLKDHHIEGAEIIVVSDGMDNCGGDPVRAAENARTQSKAIVSVIGLDLEGADAIYAAMIAQAGNGSYRNEITGAGVTLSFPGTAQSNFTSAIYQQGRPSSHLGMNALLPKPKREGAPDDSTPIVDPNSVPKEVTFAQEAKAKLPLTAPTAPPRLPAPRPTQEANPEVLGSQLPLL